MTLIETFDQAIGLIQPSFITLKPGSELQVLRYGFISGLAWRSTSTTGEICLGIWLLRPQSRCPLAPCFLLHHSEVGISSATQLCDEGHNHQ